MFNSTVSFFSDVDLAEPAQSITTVSARRPPRWFKSSKKKNKVRFISSIPFMILMSYRRPVNLQLCDKKDFGIVDYFDVDIAEPAQSNYN